ncbi:hypothetical protein QBC39DRAFT_434952 [Podospora conica]|nr:hypothetical protein QBC39DRAFT_434952 [Schizothecium conicum]
MSQKLPTCQEVEAAGGFMRVSLGWLRLRWTLRNPVATAIFVLDSGTDPNSTQTPFYLDGGEMHPVAVSPATDPPVSALKLTILPLEDHAAAWDLGHDQHDSEWDGLRRVRCCGQDVPGPSPVLEVIGTGPGGVVTVGDLVGAAHPWLMSLEDEIRTARGAARCAPLEKKFELFVYPNQPDKLDVRDWKTAGKGWKEWQWQMVATKAAKKIEKARAAAAAAAEGGEGDVEH